MTLPALRVLAAAAVLGVGLALALPGVAAPPAKDAPGKKSDKGDQAAAKLGAEVLVLHATNAQKGIDARIGNMPELKRPPFSSYDSYELLTRSTLPLEKGDAKTLRLPNGRVLKTTLIELLPKETLRLSASINRPGGRDFLPLLEVKAKVGQQFIVAGQRYKGGILVLVIRVVH